MRRPKPTVLIDTNILTSGLVFLRGNEHRILKLAEDKAITLILPQFVLEEARIVFARRFSGHEALLTAFLSRAEHTVLPWKEAVNVYSHARSRRDDCRGRVASGSE